MTEEIARCLQCDWPIRRGESWITILDMIDFLPIGYVHTGVCAYDLAVQEPRAKTQKRRAGTMRMN